MKSIKKLLKKSGHSILDEENYLVEKSQQFFEELEHLNIAEKEIEESEGDYNNSYLLVFYMVLLYEQFIDLWSFNSTIK